MLVANESAVVLCLGPVKNSFTDPHVVFKGLDVIQLITPSFHGGVLGGEPWGRMGEGSSPGAEKEKGVMAEGLGWTGVVICPSTVVSGVSGTT